MMRIDSPLMLPIVAIVDENPHVKTFYFDCPLASKPGQFVMLWIPGIDQKPFSISYDTGTRFGLSIFAVGPLSKELFTSNVGDRVGISGPYGQPFSADVSKRYIMVAGGYGAGPLAMLAEQLAGKNARVDFCVGARSADLLLFEERLKPFSSVTVHASTNDGSKGVKGYVTDVLETLVSHASTEEKQNLLVATCGPELMEKKVLDICNQYTVDCEISIERYMKCGFGICGQCCMDATGIPLCTEGPVVSRTVANQLPEFGKYHRDKTGTKIAY